MVFSGKQIDILFKEKLDDEDPVHLESKVGGILGIFGLLRVNEIMKLNVDNVISNMNENKNEAWEVEYPYPTKTKPEGFGFMIPGKYRKSFERYVAQFKEGVLGSSRFLKNMNRKSKKRIQNLGQKKVEKWPRMCGELLGLEEDVIGRYTSHSFR